MATGLNSNSGRIGTGEAQVFSSSSSINTFARILAQQKAEREREVNEIQSYLGSAKTDGLRDADRDDYFKKYDTWRTKTVEAYKARGGIEKARLKADADRELSDLNRLVSESKQVGKDYGDFQGKLIDDRIRNQFTDDAVTRVQKSAKLAMSNPDFIRDFSTLQRQVDTNAVMSEFAKLDDQLLQGAKYDNPAMREVRNGDKVGIEYSYSKSVQPTVQGLNYGALYDTRKDVKAFIQNKYANLFDSLPEEEAKKQAIQDIMSQRPLVRPDTPKIDWQPKEDNWKEKIDYREAMYRSRPDNDGDGSGGGANVPQNIPLYFGKGGKAVTTGEGTVLIPMAAKNFVGSTGVDLRTGRPTKITKSSNDYQVVSVGNYKILNRNITLKHSDGTSETLVKGSVVQDEYANKFPNSVTTKPMIHVQEKVGSVTNDKLIDYSYMVKGLTKPQKEALAGFRPSQGTATPSSKKSYSESQEKLIKDNLKQNPAYTREEIIEALGL